MFLSKFLVLTSVLFLVLACSNYSASSPVSSSDIAFYKGRYTITLETNKSVYDMYVNYDSSIQYKLSTNNSYITISKSSIKYNSQSNFFLVPLNNNSKNIFELKFKDRDNMDVKLLDENKEILDAGVGRKH